MLPLDVAEADLVERAAAQVEEELGPIDVWINNAMASVFSPVKEMTAEEYRRVTEVTYLGTVHGTLAALRRMLPRDRGTIVQVGSALAYRGIPLQSAYCAAKHAVQGFCDSLRSELLHDGSRVRALHGPAAGAQHAAVRLGEEPAAQEAQPVPPIFQPEVAARAIVWARAPRPPRGLRRLADGQGDRRQQARPRLRRPLPGAQGLRVAAERRPRGPPPPRQPLGAGAGRPRRPRHFDERATDHSPQLWATTHRGLLALARRRAGGNGGSGAETAVYLAGDLAQDRLQGLEIDRLGEVPREAGLAAARTSSSMP